MTLNTDILTLLKNEADENYRLFSEKLTPRAKNILGIRIPRLRKIAKDIVKNHDWRFFLNNAQNSYFEEDMLFGMVIGYANMPLTERLSYLQKFIPQINNWAVCDCCCSTFKFAQLYPKEIWNFISTYINSPNEYENRFAIVMMLNFFINEEYISLVLQSFEKVKHNGYYAKMALAWAISVAMVKFEAQTLAFLKNCTLNDWVFNKSIQKICESYRISPELKSYLKRLKRK